MKSENDFPNQSSIKDDTDSLNWFPLKPVCENIRKGPKLKSVYVQSKNVGGDHG